MYVYIYLATSNIIYKQVLIFWNFEKDIEADKVIINVVPIAMCQLLSDVPSPGPLKLQAPRGERQIKPPSPLGVHPSASHMLAA